MRMPNTWSKIDAEALPERFRSQFAALHAAMHRERPLPRESVDARIGAQDVER